MMERRDNYAIQAQQAKLRFLTYDQQEIVEKLHLQEDENWIYIPMLCRMYRIGRKDGNFQRQAGEAWQDANTYEEVMTLLDLLCDSKKDRYLTGRWKNLQEFGLMFHRTLLEEKDPWAQLFQERSDEFRKACLTLGGIEMPQGDIAYAIELFDGLRIGVQLWFGDEEFPANLRYLWDENALMYLKYETMYFAKALLLHRLREEMEK